MMNSNPDPDVTEAEQDASVGAIMRSGAKGAIVLAGLATAAVLATWLAFYLLVFVPRVMAP